MLAQPLCQTCDKPLKLWDNTDLNNIQYRCADGHPPREGREDGERCDGSGKFKYRGKDKTIEETYDCEGCDNCRNQEAAKCACDSDVFPMHSPTHCCNGNNHECEARPRPAHGAAKGEDDEVETLIDGFIRKWCGDSVPHLLDNDENDGQRLRDSIRTLLSRSEKVGEARRTDEILNWLKAALWEEEFSKVEMVVNGHLKSGVETE